MNPNKYKYFLLKTPITLSFLFVLFSFTPVHRYYFSVSEVRVDTQKSTLNVSCKLFTDDLTTELNNFCHKKVVLDDSQDKEDHLLLARYLSEHFKIAINGKPLKLTFIGYEHEDDATWCYLEVPKFSQKGKITITDDLLFDLFPDQINIIQFYWDQQNKSQKLVNPEKEAVFEF